MDGWNICGVLGMICFILAYGLQQAHVVTRDHVRYQLLNLVGAGLLIASLLVHWNLPALVLEIVWVFITLYGLGRTLRKRWCNEASTQ